jgi:hypothetical protein
MGWPVRHALTTLNHNAQYMLQDDFVPVLLRSVVSNVGGGL